MEGKTWVCFFLLNLFVKYQVKTNASYTTRQPVQFLCLSSALPENASQTISGVLPGRAMFTFCQKKKKENKTVLYWPVRNYKIGTWEKLQLLKLFRLKEAKQINKTKQKASFTSVTFLAQTNLLRIKKLLCLALLFAPFLFLFSYETKAMKISRQYLPRSGQSQGMKQDWRTWASKTPYAGSAFLAEVSVALGSWRSALSHCYKALLIELQPNCSRFATS